ncbi:MAG: M14 family zinc carboxypeptidase, partial [Acidobacteriota bacterium]
MTDRPVSLCRCLLAVLALILATVSRLHAAAVPTPAEALGIAVGHDRALASYSETRGYFRLLAERSERVRTFDIGQTVEARPIVAAAISAPGNLLRLEELRAGWARLADPRGLASGEREHLIATLPSCVLITAGIHSTEVAGSQSALLLAHRLAAAPAGSAEAEWLENVVVLIVPSVNPDGQEATVAWYRKYLGTAFEGSSPPFLYHRYAGHDNNRDFVFLTQPESRALNRLAYRDWHPQVFLDLHQMQSNGPRQFVPPFAEPIAPNVHPLIWRMTSLIGSWMSLRLEEAGKAGVVSGWKFDGNWIGGTRNTGWWKNVFGLLTETASAALATPLEVDENELEAADKGLWEYRQQINFPNPWRGGRWGLADAVSYQTGLMAALVEFAASHRSDLLRGVAAIAGDALSRARAEPPIAYLLGPNGRDPGRTRHLAELLREAGVEVSQAPNGVVADGIPWPPGTVVVTTEQPLRQYLVEVMARQSYPEISLAQGSEILLPYDITAWTMPLYLDVAAGRAERGLFGELQPYVSLAPAEMPSSESSTEVLAVSAERLASFAAANRALASGAAVARVTTPPSAGEPKVPAGSFVVSKLPRKLAATLGMLDVTPMTLAEPPASASPLRPIKVGVYHPSFGLDDAGWCRWVLEQAGFTVEVVDSKAISSGGFAKLVDVLVLPPLSGKVIVEGPRSRLVEPPLEFRGGIGKDGVEAVKRFFAGGGTVIGFAASAEWLIEALE